MSVRDPTLRRGGGRERARATEKGMEGASESKSEKTAVKGRGRGLG